METLKLYIGNKNYSSWSMRSWLVLRKSELPFEESQILLDVPGYKEKLLALTEAGTVPVLETGEGRISDSLAISEFLAKAVPNLWPSDQDERAQACAFCKQLQDDFSILREHAPMNLKRRIQTQMPGACLKAAARLEAVWSEFLQKKDATRNGPFLFGDWSIADAFSTPYATRFVSYDIPRGARADTYISELMLDEDYLDWEAEALAEPWKLSHVDSI